MAIVIELQNYNFHIGQTVFNEIIELRDIVQQHVADRRITLLPDHELSFDDVADFADNNNLGLGESECLLFCLRRPQFVICSDDGRARRISANLLGNERVLGTADLLQQCVRQGLLTPQDAFSGYEQMRIRGAFLPELPREYFIV